MNCNEFGEALASALYGELPPPRLQQMQQHRDTCPGCQREWQQGEETARALDAYVLPPVRPTELSSLQGPAPSRWSGLRQVAVAAAVLLLVAAGGFVVAGVQVDWGEGYLRLQFGAAPPLVASGPTGASEAPGSERAPGPQATPDPLSTEIPPSSSPSAAVLERRIDLLERIVLEFGERYERDLLELAVAVDRSRAQFLRDLRDIQAARPGRADPRADLLSFPRAPFVEQDR